MGSFTEPLRRNAVTVGLSLFIALGVAWYVLGYLPAREQDLRARYFRVMERIGENMQGKSRAFGKRSEAMVREIRYKVYPNPPSSGIPVKTSKTAVDSAYQSAAILLRKQWQDQGLISPEFEKLERMSEQPRRGELLSLAEDNQRLQFTYGFEDFLRLTASSNIREFTQGLLRPDAFEHFMILGTNPRKLEVFDQIYYQSFQAPATLTLTSDSKKGVGLWLRDTTGIQAPRLVELTIGGKPYKLFIQPVRMSPRVTWLLGGAVATGNFDAQRRELPENLIDLILGTVLVGMLALPFLKVTLMGARERLSRWDVVLCGLSLVLGTAFLLLLAHSLVAKHLTEPKLLKKQIAALGAQVEQELYQELQVLNVVLRTTDNALIASKYLQSNLPVRTSPTDFSATPKKWPNPVLKTADSAVVQARAWQKDDQLFWINAAGNMVFSVDTLGDDFLPNLRERTYHRRWKANQLWQLYPPEAAEGKADTFTLESLVTFGRTGDKLAVYARPSRINLQHIPADDTLKKDNLLAVYSTHLRSLSNPILPPGYSFCVIDDKGEIKFHSDARLNLSENMLTDCEPAGALRAAMFTRDVATVAARYQGQEFMVRIQPLQEWPLFLVTLADLHVVHARQMQTLSLAGTLLSTFSLLAALFLGLYMLVLPSRHTVLTMPYSLRRLWPRTARVPTYVQIAAALLGGTFLLFLFSLFAGPLVQLLLLPLVPLYAFLFTFFKLRLPTDNLTPSALTAGTWRPLMALHTLWNASGGLRYVRRLTLSFALVYNLIAWYWTGVAWIAGGLLQLLLVLLLLALPELGRRLEVWSGIRPRAFNQTGTQLTYSSITLKRTYSVMLLSWIVVLSIAPAIYCYQIAYRAERELQIRHAHLALARVMQAAPPRAPGQEGLQRKGYLRFFFDTRSSTTPVVATKQVPFTRAENNYRELITWLHPEFDTLSRNMQRVLPRGSAHLANWIVTSSWDTLTTAQSGPPSARATSNYFTSSISDLHWGQHWYFPSDLLKKDSPDIADFWTWLRTLAGLLLLLISLYHLLYLLARRVFNLDMLDLKTLVCATTSRPINADLPRHEYQLCATKNTYPAAQAAPEVATRHLDCRELLPYEKGKEVVPEKWQAQIRQAAKGVVVALDYFDYHPHDPALTQSKIAVLNYVQQHCHANVVIASRVHPVVFADCGHTRDKCTDKENHKVIWQTGDALLDALADFQLIYVPMTPTPPLQLYTCWEGSLDNRKLFENKLNIVSPNPNKVLMKAHFWYLRCLVEVECSALPFLGLPMEKELEKLLIDNYRLGQRLSEDDIILSIQQRAQFHFRQLWDTLTPYEQYLLYDVAQDGLVNSRDAQVINDLLQKGLLTYSHVGLRPVNESFRFFILNGLPPQQALRIEREAAEEAERDGTWSRRSLPIFLTLSAAALFIFVTQRSVLNEAQTFLTALTATLPLLYRFVSLTPFSSGTVSKAATT
ncbi:hypothetical protein [Hymenobacter sp. GOD-10R]|uniref:hypothetical protein n=1 Tax=Hymenobacter sp. GOD-10R TaxID=3093922 RepID=UPI002D76667E|nr:hypothetical protein [Hymenobacter sp. GOD-10R]WRQ28930.1 hypothetical protein SD425_01460 [Hymenobacter sp. GOD-10R]